MWIVQLALRRPYTFIVAALALLLLGVVTISRMPTDIFPVIDIPVVGNLNHLRHVIVLVAWLLALKAFSLLGKN
jgi:cell division septal protein FtsQ